MVPAPSAKYLVLALWLSTILYVQLRGHVRHKLKRLAADHANVLATIRDTKALDDATSDKLKTIIGDFVKTFA